MLLLTYVRFSRCPLIGYTHCVVFFAPTLGAWGSSLQRPRRKFAVSEICGKIEALTRYEMKTKVGAVP